jgi:hypothetical protein
MERKQLIQRMIEKLPEDVSYDRVMYHLAVMKAVETGMQEIERGEGIDHDELFDELEQEDAFNKDLLVPTSEARSPGNSSPHKRTRSRKGRQVHKPTSRKRRQA